MREDEYVHVFKSPPECVNRLVEIVLLSMTLTLTPAEAYLAKDLELGVASCRS